MHGIVVFKIFLLQKSLQLVAMGSWKPDQLLRTENPTGTWVCYVHMGMLLNSL